MDEYVECDGCDFVYLAADVSEPAAKHHDSCPNCGGENFRFISG